MPQPRDDQARDAILSSNKQRAIEMLAHADMHRWHATRWRVGATALDTLDGMLTENVTTLFGLPVEVDCSLGRDSVVLDWEEWEP